MHIIDILHVFIIQFFKCFLMEISIFTKKIIFGALDATFCGKLTYFSVFQQVLTDFNSFYSIVLV